MAMMVLRTKMKGIGIFLSSSDALNLMLLKPIKRCREHQKVGALIKKHLPKLILETEEHQNMGN